MNKEFDVKYKEHLTRKILDLKNKKNALIVAHNYQRDEIQDIADITGDSYALARKVTEAEQDLVVFCGVKFMAESAYMLNPHKTILLPVEEAGCPLADMATVEKLKKRKKNILRRQWFHMSIPPRRSKLRVIYAALLQMP